MDSFHQSGQLRLLFRRVREHTRALWRVHRRTFWILHSIWALATGFIVVWLSDERYGFTPWVVGFLALTWTSSLYFSRSEGNPGRGLGVGSSLASYIMRVMYQETLFFLLPFYAYSTVLTSYNVLFLVLLGGLAIVACLDLVFDRWLREYRVFGLFFFTVVAFAATNLLFPMLTGFSPETSIVLAAFLSVVSAILLTVRWGRSSFRARLRVGVAGAVIFAVIFLARGVVPAVPLRLKEITFGSGFDRLRFSVTQPLGREARVDELQGALVVLAEVFAPSNIPAGVVLEWSRDGNLLRTSREVRVVAHQGGFRVWDVYGEKDALKAGLFRIVLKTSDGRVFGAGQILLR